MHICVCVLYLFEKKSLCALCGTRLSEAWAEPCAEPCADGRPGAQKNQVEPKVPCAVPCAGLVQALCKHFRGHLRFGAPGRTWPCASLVRARLHKDIWNPCVGQALHKATLEKKPCVALCASYVLREVALCRPCADFCSIDFSL